MLSFRRVIAKDIAITQPCVVCIGLSKLKFAANHVAKTHVFGNLLVRYQVIYLLNFQQFHQRLKNTRHRQRKLPLLQLPQRKLLLQQRGKTQYLLLIVVSQQPMHQCIRSNLSVNHHLSVYPLDWGSY